MWPEDFIISPDPAPPGAPTGPRLAVAGDVLIVAALPDPVGVDRGNELITLVNASASPIELSGWGLIDAVGGRQDLTGTIAGGAVVQVAVDGTIQLGNRSDAIILIDAAAAPSTKWPTRPTYFEQVAPSASAGNR